VSLRVHQFLSHLKAFIAKNVPEPFFTSMPHLSSRQILLAYMDSCRAKRASKHNLRQAMRNKRAVKREALENLHEHGMQRMG